jgi:hypothetical protein
MSSHTEWDPLEDDFFAAGEALADQPAEPRDPADVIEPAKQPATLRQAARTVLAARVAPVAERLTFTGRRIFYGRILPMVRPAAAGVWAVQRQWILRRPWLVLAAISVVLSVGAGVPTATTDDHRAAGAPAVVVGPAAHPARIATRVDSPPRHRRAHRNRPHPVGRIGEIARTPARR